MTNNLPKNWDQRNLEDVATIIMGQSPPSKYYNTEKDGLPFFQGKTEFSDFYPQAVKWCSQPGKIAEKDDVLISVRAPVGPTNLAPSECCIGRGLAAIRAHGDIPKKYLLYYLRSIENEIQSLGTGTTFKAISGKTLKSLLVPIAPREQQDRIVEEIEKQFSRLDEAVANLKRIKANLKRYKASVLKAAVEGKLTEEWRKQHPDVEPASKLLERISEKRNEWIRVESAKGNNEARRLGTKLKKHRFKAPADLKLPKNWEWTSFVTSSQLVVDCHNKTAPYKDRGISLVRTTNVRDGKLDVDTVKYVSQETYEYWSRRCPPKPGDILFTREAPMGEAAIIPKDAKVCMGQRMMLIRLFPDLINNRYFLYAILEPHFQSRFSQGAVGMGVKHLRVGDVESLVIPIPPIHEQYQIVEEIESRLSVAEAILKETESNLQKTERLRQSILMKAFSGCLFRSN